MLKKTTTRDEKAEIREHAKIIYDIPDEKRKILLGFALGMRTDMQFDKAATVRARRAAVSPPPAAKAETGRLARHRESPHTV